MNRDNDLTESEFARLVIAELHIKQLQKEMSDLKVENGILQSERDELNYIIKSEDKKSLSKEDKIMAKSNELVVQLTKKNAKLSKEVKSLRESNSELVSKLDQQNK